LAGTFYQVFAELLKTSIVVVSDVGIRLAEFLSDLRKRVPLEKVESQCFSLVFGQVVHDPLPRVPAE
jgi:hypothetical protein